MDSLGDFFQKTVYFGLGVTAYVAEKMGKFDESLSEFQTQTQQFVDELVERGEQVAAQTHQNIGMETDGQVFSLRRRLLEMTNHNEDLANRLVENVKVKNPDRSLKWVYEKVIWDLERDRNL